MSTTLYEKENRNICRDPKCGGWSYLNYFYAWHKLYIMLSQVYYVSHILPYCFVLIIL